MGSTGNDIFDSVTMHSPLVRAWASTASEQHHDIEPMECSRCCQRDRPIGGGPQGMACASYRVTSRGRSAILKKKFEI
jgi:hypothetical protein